MESLEKKELKARAEAKHKKLEARIAEMKADASKSGSDALEKAQTQLDEINKAAKDGWDNLSDATAEKLNKFLRD